MFWFEYIDCCMQCKKWGGNEMKILSKISAVVLCLSLMFVSPVSAFAADSGSWNISGTPQIPAVSQTITLDYSSNGYKATVNTLQGSSTSIRLLISSINYSSYNVFDFTKVTSASVGAPTYKDATVPFVVKLKYNGTNAFSTGRIARR